MYVTGQWENGKLKWETGQMENPSEWANKWENRMRIYKYWTLFWENHF